MSMDTTRTALEGYFHTSWTSTPIQYHGVPFDGGVSKWIGLKFVPVRSDRYAFDGTNGRVAFNSQLQVFCYDTSPAKCIKLADSVMAFLNNKEFAPDIVVELGQAQGAPIDLGNSVFELLVTFECNTYE
jgi:hypothetical protein